MRPATRICSLPASKPPTRSWALCPGCHYQRDGGRHTAGGPAWLRPRIQVRVALQSVVWAGSQLPLASAATLSASRVWLVISQGLTLCTCGFVSAGCSRTWRRAGWTTQPSAPTCEALGKVFLQRLIASGRLLALVLLAVCNTRPPALPVQLMLAFPARQCPPCPAAAPTRCCATCTAGCAPPVRGCTTPLSSRWAVGVGC